jgi:hypothetical protein
VWRAEDRRRALGQRLAHIEEAVTDLGSRPDQLTHGARVLIESLGQLFERIRGHFDAFWEEYSQLPDPDERDRFQSELCGAVLEVVKYLAETVVPVISGADSRLVPVELEQALRAAVRTVPNPDANPAQIPVLHASNPYNYGIEEMPHQRRVWVRQIGPPHDLATDEVDPPDFLFFSVPLMEKDAAFLHSILLGHEIGHLWDWRFGITNGLLPPVGTAVTRQEKLKRDIEGQWVNELVADVLSCYLLGPVAVFSLLELANVTTTLNLDLTTHPSPQRRIKLMIEVLDEQGEFRIDGSEGDVDVLAAERERTSGAWEEAVHGRGFYEEHDAAGAWQWVKDRLPELRKECADAFKEGLREPFSVDDWVRAAAASEVLSRGMPCGDELGDDGKSRPVPVPVILNAAFRAKIGGLADLGQQLAIEVTPTSPLGQANRVNEVLDLLALKSMEISGQLAAPNA